MNRTTSKRRTERTTTAADVEDYLRRHSDFFTHHLELLENLKVPHPCGDAVSLVSRQIAVLRDKNRQLQFQLNDILQIARENDALYQRIHQLTLTLLDANGTEDALGGLRWGLHEYFQADFVGLRILEPEVETPLADLRVASPRRFLELFGSMLETGRPQCGRPDPEYAELLFGRDGSEVFSYALVPLQHAGLKGLLAIGSRNSSRFQPGMGLLFLTQMGEIVAARLAALLQGQV